jgi:putative NADH-flavin reductase
MRVAVFGASGRTGRHVVERGLERGHEIRAFVRDASRFGTSHERLQIVQGDARDPDAVAGAVRGNEAAVSVLALMKADDEPGYSEATRTIVEAAEREAVRRVVVTANNDVFGDDEVTGEYAPHAREHRRNRETLKASDLDWTIVAAGWVVDEPATGSYHAVVDAKASKRKVSPEDFATAILDALERDEWIGHIVGVTNAT